MFDYYQLLKVPPNARQVDIDRAYQKLVKEAQYNQTLNRREIEKAYRTLSDATQRALYDATAAAKAKQVAATQKASRRVRQDNRM